MNNIQEFWENIANEHPYFGVLTNEKFYNQHYLKNKTEYINSGNGDIQYVLNYLSNIENIEDFKKYNFLEIGIGTARIAMHSINYCNNLYGIDISDKYLSIADEELKNLNYKNYELVNYKNFYTHKFENIKLIYTFITLQHNPPEEIKKIVKKVCNILIDGGYAFLHIPYQQTVGEYIYKDVLEMQMNIVPKDIILSIILENNCSILDTHESNKCGDKFKDATYIIKKSIK